MSTLPLLPDTSASSVIAYRNSRPVSRAEFLQEVFALAERLPHTAHVINLCKDRYWFAVALFASISRGILSILPNSTAPENINTLRDEISDLLCLSDQPRPPFDNLPYLRVDHANQMASGSTPAVPRIPFDRPIVSVYTSGSTGKPRPHTKTFGRVVQCAAIEAERIWATSGGPCSVLGTVPFQHMYGLESTVLLPILGNGQLSSRLPFFPADIVAALDELPAQRILVTTPFHLRKLMDADIDLPQVAAIISATAPLSRELASEAESKLAAPLIEIYGSTETGQLATRQPTLQNEWDAFDGIELKQRQGVTIATGGHLERMQELNDVVELVSPSRFRLIGRNSDMINIVGKRNSLAFLNHVITSLPGVHDGVFCLPDNGSPDEATRLAAFVVAPGLKPADIVAKLTTQLDPVFLPRPIVFLDSLPRNDNGKIPASAMSALIAEHLSQRI